MIKENADIAVLKNRQHFFQEQISTAVSRAGAGLAAIWGQNSRGGWEAESECFNGIKVSHKVCGSIARLFARSHGLKPGCTPSISHHILPAGQGTPNIHHPCTQLWVQRWHHITAKPCAKPPSGPATGTSVTPISLGDKDPNTPVWNDGLGILGYWE